MRTISQAALDTIVRQTAVEPVIIISVYWDIMLPINYCDRKFVESGLVGKLLSVGGIDDIVDVNSSASSVTLNVVLDDSDGEIKNIFNTKDIHKCYVKVKQWFVGLPLNDAFLIFEGEITSPILWNEGERSLSFDVTSAIEDKEVGFSAEEDSFPTLPADLVGVPWPIVFGSVTGMKPLLLYGPPTLTLAEGFGIVDDDLWNIELNKLRESLTNAENQARAAFEAGEASAIKASTFKGFSHFFKDDPQQADQYDNAAASYFDQSATYTAERLKITAQLKAQEDLYAAQKGTERLHVPLKINQADFPLPPPGSVGGPDYQFDSNGYRITGNVIGQVLLISKIEPLDIVNQNTGTNNYQFTDTSNQYQKSSNQRNKFTWIDGGTELKVINFPTKYLISLGRVTSVNVWGETNIGKTLIPAPVFPKPDGVINFYTIDANDARTTITFDQQLMTLPGNWKSNDIIVDATGTIAGNNPVEIMQWAIQNYSKFGTDPISFGHVGALLNKWPMNFVLNVRKNLVEFLKDIAYQARCAIWLRDRTFFIRYLPEPLAAVDTITADDIEVNTLQITCTPTEDVRTKYVATWKAAVNQATDYKIIYRYNILKYGTVEESYNFYCYTNPEPVQKAAEFWLIRKANTWKRIKFKTMLHKLRLEMFDPVAFDFGNTKWIANGIVIGIIEKATFDSATDSIEIEAWLPIRFGEMDTYEFAQAMNVSTIYPKINDPNIVTGNPFGAGGDLVPSQYLSPLRHLTVTHGNVKSTTGRGLPAGDATDPTPSIQTNIVTNGANTGRPDWISTANDARLFDIKNLKTFELTNTNPSTFFGKVKSFVVDDKYLISTYLNGLDNDPTDLEVRIAFLREEDSIPDGQDYPITVNRTIYINDDKEKEVEFWAQPPVWVPPSSS